MSEKMINISTNLEFIGAGIVFIGGIVMLTGMAIFDIPVHISGIKMKRQVKEMCKKVDDCLNSLDS